MLKLLKELRCVLETALDSLATQKPPSPESRYVGDAAKAVNIASDGYILLRESARVHASKLMIRPLIDVVITSTAVTKKKGFLFRVAFTELNKMKKLYDKSSENEARAKAIEESLKKRFSEDPSYPIECKQVDVRLTAEVAGLLPVYQTAYGLYCEFTHSAMRAVNGQLDQTTDPIDTSMVIWAVGVMLNQLKFFTPASVPDLTPFNDRILQAHKDILGAWGNTV